MLRRYYTLIISFIFILSLSESYAANKTQKLFLLIKYDKSGLSEVDRGRYQRSLMKKIIELGKFEFQIIASEKLSKTRIDGILLQIKVEKSAIAGSFMIISEVNKYIDGKEESTKKKSIPLQEIELYTKGIEQVIALLKKEK